MAMTIHVDIVSAESEIYSGQAEMVIAPAVMGEVGIVPGHTPFLGSLGITVGYPNILCCQCAKAS